MTTPIFALIRSISISVDVNVVVVIVRSGSSFHVIDEVVDVIGVVVATGSGAGGGRRGARSYYPFTGGNRMRTAATISTTAADASAATRCLGRTAKR